MAPHPHHLLFFFLAPRFQKSKSLSIKAMAPHPHHQVLPKNRPGGYPHQHFSDPAPLIATCTNKMELRAGDDPDIRPERVPLENVQLNERIVYVKFKEKFEDHHPELFPLPEPCPECWSRLFRDAGRRLCEKQDPYLKRLPRDTLARFVPYILQETIDAWYPIESDSNSSSDED